MDAFLTASSAVEAIAALAVLVALVLDTVRFRTRAGVILLLATIAGTSAGIGDLVTATLESGTGAFRVAEAFTDVLFVAFAYLLYAFSREYRHPAPHLDALMKLGGIALAIAAIALPARPELGAPRETWDVIYTIAFVAYFELGVVTAGIRMWRDGSAARSTLVRLRMHGLGAGMSMLAVAFVVAETATGELQLGLARLLASSGAVVLVVCYLQPRALRAATLGRERERVSTALMHLLVATTVEDVDATMLPLIAQAVGAEEVLLSEADGTEHRWSDVGVAASLTSKPDETRADVQSIDTPSGRLVVRSSPYASVLGTEELTTVRLLATYALLALDRCRQLELERDAVHELAELKNAFVAATAHDLRTPLTAVLGFAMTLQSLGDTFDAAQRAALLHEIVTGGQRLQRLLDDLLEVSRLDLRRGLVTRTDTELLALAQASVAPLSLAGSSILVRGVEVHLAVDAHKVQRVIENLVTNADRHTQDGARIEVIVEPEPAGGARISIDDDGPGIPEHLRQRVFEPFERGGAHSSVEGSGLGLAIVQRFTVAHGGRIELSQSPMGGARFVVHLPAPNGDQQDAGLTPVEA